jgi:HK97 family phage portal protein
MNLRSRLALAWKQAKLVFSGTALYGLESSWWQAIDAAGHSPVNYEREAGDLWTNSAIASCLYWIFRAFPEADLQIVTELKGVVTPIPSHPMLLLVDGPNPYYGGDELWAGILLSWFLDGNYYLLKVRDATGQVVELWYIPHFMIRPVWPKDGSEFVSGYEYRVNGKKFFFERRDVIHGRLGIDPRNPRSGFSPMKSVLREVASDNLASQFAAAMLKNMGVPGVIISPKDEACFITDEDADAIKAKFKAHFTGEGRGEPLINTVPLDIQAPAFSPDQLNLEKIRNVPEERITAAFGLPAVVVGLGAGLDRSTFSNVRQMRQAAYEGCLKPTQRAIASVFQKQLLPEIGNPSTYRVRWCYDDIAAFADERQALAEELSLLYQSQLIWRSEAKKKLGYPVHPGDDVYFEPPAAGTGGSPGDTPRRPKPKNPAATGRSEFGDE